MITFSSQELSMPDDSFVLKYFKYLNKYLSVGPPFYIVINNTQIAKGKGHGFDFSNYTLQNRICGGQGCNSDSLQTQVIFNLNISFDPN
jgi:Niemann-Pick C1 protein